LSGNSTLCRCRNKAYFTCPIALLKMGVKWRDWERGKRGGAMLGSGCVGWRCLVWLGRCILPALAPNKHRNELQLPCLQIEAPRRRNALSALRAQPGQGAQARPISRSRASGCVTGVQLGDLVVAEILILPCLKSWAKFWCQLWCQLVL
jgi:hypothetical protein